MFKWVRNDGLPKISQSEAIRVNREYYDEQFRELGQMIYDLKEAVFPEHGKKNGLINNVYPLAEKIDMILDSIKWLRDETNGLETRLSRHMNMDHKSKE